MPMHDRRRILYIRHRRTVEISDAFRMNQDEWFEALSELADVTLQDQDFDLSEACDRVRPDFILYESPYLYAAPLNIANATAHAQIPRIGFLMQDPVCNIRTHFLRMLDTLNIQWIISPMAEATVRQSPELRSRVFSVSFMFDDRVFHDYGLRKDIPVSIFGGFLAPEIYRWRADTARAITDHFPTLIYTHPGYQKPIPAHKFPVAGEDYAHLLNRSHFSLADNTRFDYVVRKHLEIPASGAVLVAPDAPALKPYGFKDMENCILGQGGELFEKIAAVTDNPALYESIRQNGYNLIHAKYSRKSWRGIPDFYECLRELKPGQTVRQNGVLGLFEAVSSSDVMPPAISAEIPDSDISRLFKHWLHIILENNVSAIEIPNWAAHMEEQFVLLGIMVLLRGDLRQAHELFMAPQKLRKDGGGFAAYDPEEIAWLSLTASLLGDAKILTALRQHSASMRHLSLRRMLWLTEVLASGGDASNPPAAVLRYVPGDQLSIHWTGQLDIKQWLSLIARILAANGQKTLLRHF